MKKLVLLSALAVFSVSAMSQAMVSEEWARVKRAEPIYGQATAIQRNRCHTEMVTRNVQPAQVPSSNPNIGGAILGTIVGGVIGNQIGGGTGKDVATAAGAGLGAVIGSNSGSSSNAPLYGTSETVPIEKCRPVTEMQPAPMVGYRVILDYNGKDYVYQSPTAPRDEYVKVRVSIQPIF